MGVKKLFNNPVTETSRRSSPNTDVMKLLSTVTNVETLLLLSLLYQNQTLVNSFTPITKHPYKINIMPRQAPSCTPGGKCVPCETLDKSRLLSKDQISSQLKELKLWQVNNVGNKISFAYTARNFQRALDSINAIGSIAEREGHHPDIHLTGYRNVEIVLFTHSLGGVSANDIALAQMIVNEVTIDYSPKWYKENVEGRLSD